MSENRTRILLTAILAVTVVSTFMYYGGGESLKWFRDQTGRAYAAPSTTITTVEASMPATSPPTGVPPAGRANEAGPTPHVPKGVQNTWQWRYEADSRAKNGDWGLWLSYMGVHKLDYNHARLSVDWMCAEESKGRSFMTVVGNNGLTVINTRPKSGSYEPFKSWLAPGDRYLALTPDNPFLSRPPIPGDGIRAGCGNPIGGIRTCIKNGVTCEEIPTPPPPPDSDPHPSLEEGALRPWHNPGDSQRSRTHAQHHP